MSIALAKAYIALAQQALNAIPETPPPPPVEPPPPPPLPPYIPTGSGLRIEGDQRYSEITVDTVGKSALFSGYFDKRVLLSCETRGAGPILVELLANGQRMGSGPGWTLEPGSYQFILSGGAQRPNVLQVLAARPV